MIPSSRACGGEPEPRRLLAIDPGTKRIGFAISDDLGWTARPLEVWRRRSVREDVAHVRALVKAHGIAEIVFGVPYRLDGSKSASTERALEFRRSLGRALPDVTIVERDEALTTWDAERKLEERGLVASANRARIDAVAAAVILQEELDARQALRRSPSDALEEALEAALDGRVD